MYRNIGRGQRWGREQRIQQIQWELHYSRYDVHTVNSIAKLVNMTPSQHLRGILADMCSRGELLCSTEEDDTGTVTRRLYALPHRAPKQEEIEGFRCKNCGSKLVYNALDCPWCGYEIEVQS